MNQILSVLTILNFLGLLYLTFLIYQKNRSRSKDLPKTTGNNPKIYLTRFNPFDDLGGDQSFILCLLDNTNSGVIITSLHNRDITRIYAKNIKNGQADGISLSKEEKSAILKTIKN